jgi:PhzF family phenazine biosynthesis protein
VLSPSDAEHDVVIRFFTPTTEVPSCGHATIAAHYVRAIEKRMPSSEVVQKIGAGVLPVHVIHAEGDYHVIMTQGAIEFTEPFDDAMRGQILDALGLTPDDLDDRCPVQIVSTGHSKVLIGIRERAKLNALHPNLSRLKEVSAAINSNGFYAFVLDLDAEDVKAYGRMFAPAIGIAEDPVTGNANGPLGAYLVQHQLVSTHGRTFSFRARQGDAMGRPGIIEVTVEMLMGEPKLVRVGGRAVIVFRGELEL